MNDTLAFWPVVIDVLREASGGPTPGLSPSTRFAELGLDSIRLVELVAEIEDRCGVRLQARDLFEVESLGDLLKLIEKGSGVPNG